ncbi:cytochrome P450 [Catenulispora subtropica]|uniref:Cytochrome P450 n=1 Tax=Catenulispora subtropica TaxID=450798 RepID=A0ABN2TG12_9ACTN
MSDLPVLNTSDPDYTRDPYAVLAPLREKGPVVRVVLDGLPVWLVVGHDEAVQVLSSPRMSNDGIRNSGPGARAVFWTGAMQRGLQSHMGRLDPPDHTRLRRLVQQAFTPRRVAALEPWIRRIARDLIAGFPVNGEVDLIGSFAAPLPITVIAELLGIEPEERADFRRWADLYLHSDETQAELMAEAGGKVGALLAGLLARRRAGLGDAPLDVAHEGTLTDGLIRARDQEDRLDERELVSLCFLLLGAGYDTTLNLIGNAALLLLSEPGRLRALRAAPGTLAEVIEEVLRLDPPVKAVFLRYPLEDTELGGVRVLAGEPVMVHFSVVSRDPRRYSDPDAYVPGRAAASRTEAGHLTFGHGLHYCLGAPLARLEARVAFEELLRACPGLALAEPVEKLRWQPSRLFRGLAALPVHVERPVG